jgi:hypothetical protein
MTTTPQEPEPGADDPPILDDREEAERLHGSEPPVDPEREAMLETVATLSETGPTTAGDVADETRFPLTEVLPVLEQLSPDEVTLGDDGPDGTPAVSPA